MEGEVGAGDAEGAEVWESLPHRVRLPEDIQLHLGITEPTLRVPLNVIGHVQNDHPKDAPYLDRLQEIVEAASYMTLRSGSGEKTVLYSEFDGVWLRVVVTQNQARNYAVMTSLYRRKAQAVMKAISDKRIEPR